MWGDSDPDRSVGINWMCVDVWLAGGSRWKKHQAGRGLCGGIERPVWLELEPGGWGGSQVWEVSKSGWELRRRMKPALYKASRAASWSWVLSARGRWEDRDQVEAGRPTLVHARGDGGLGQGEARSGGPLVKWFRGPEETTGAESQAHGLAHGRRRPGLAAVTAEPVLPSDGAGQAPATLLHAPQQVTRKTMEHSTFGFRGTRSSSDPDDLAV